MVKAKENYSLSIGDILETRDITTEAKKDKYIQVDSDLKITYKDENMVMVENGSVKLVHSDEKEGEPTLTDHVLSYLNQKGDYNPTMKLHLHQHPCNRLDRNTKI